MRYLEMLTNNASKLMSDLANLLDDLLFQLDGIKESYQRTEMAALREEVFHDFCALCVQAGIPVPAMEVTLIAAQAPSADEQTRKLHATRTKVFIGPVLKMVGRKNSAKARTVRALAESFTNLPTLSSQYPGHVTGKQLECVINQMLIELGQEPVRPDYQSRCVKSLESQPRTEKKIVIVDDDRKEILKTARALAGWEGLRISFYQYEPSERWGMTPEKCQAELSRAAKAIMELKPDVVLMDQGLGPIEGDDLVRKIKEICPDDSPIFVANTGGSDSKLRAVGALENCDKGRRIDGVVRAVRS